MFTVIRATREIAKSTQASLWTNSATENRHRYNSTETAAAEATAERQQQSDNSSRDNSRRGSSTQTTEQPQSATPHPTLHILPEKHPVRLLFDAFLHLHEKLTNSFSASPYYTEWESDDESPYRVQ